MNTQRHGKPRNAILIGSVAVLAALPLLIIQQSSKPTHVQSQAPAPLLSTRGGSPHAVIASLPSAKGGITLHRKVEEAPLWTVAYGSEFWRRSSGTTPAVDQDPSMQFDLGDVIERVSYAVDWSPAGGLPGMSTKTFTATFDEQGLRFSPNRVVADDEAAPKLEPDPATEFRLATKSIRVGEQTLYTQGAELVSWSILGNTVQGLLSETAGLVEHYETRSEGVEVTWVLNQRPTTAGPLEIEASYSGLTYTGQNEDGYESFSDDQAVPRVKIGTVLLVDARGQRTQLTPTFDATGLRVEVPEALWQAADFPIAIDPTVSPEFGMGIAMAPNSQHRPTVAWNGTNYLVVWDDLRSDRNDLYGTRITPAGQVLEPSGICVCSNNTALSPRVASNGRDFFVVWEDWRRNGYDDIYGTVVRGNGTVSDGLGYPVSQGPWHERWSAIAYSGTNYLVAWKDDRLFNGNNCGDIYGTLVTSNGTVLNTNGFIISTNTVDSYGLNFPQVAGNGSEFLVGWDRTAFNDYGFSNNFCGSRVSTSGAVLDGNGVVLATNGSWGSIAWAASAQNYMVAYLYSMYGPYDRAVKANRITVTNGIQILDGAGLSITNNPEGGALTFIRPHLASNGTNYLVAYGQQRVDEYDSTQNLYGARVRASDGAILDSPFPLCMWGGADFELQVASDKKGFLAVWVNGATDYENTNNNVYGALIGNDGVVKSFLPVSTLATTYESVSQGNSAVAYGCNAVPGYYLVVWEDARNAATGTDIYGTRINTEGFIMDPAGIAICTASGTQNRPAICVNATDRDQFLVAWQDGRGANSLVYANRITNGVPADANGFVICSNQYVQSSAAVTSLDTNYLVAWQESRSSYDVYAARVSISGTVLDQSGIAVSTNAASAELVPRIATVETNYFVVWSENRNSANFDIYGARLSSGGQLLDPNGIAVCTDTNSQTTPFVAASATQALVVWQDNRAGNVDCYGARVTSTGTVLDTNGFAINTGTNIIYAVNVACNGVDFLVTWQDRIVGSTTYYDIGGARVSSTGTVLDSNGFTINRSSGYQMNPAVAYGDTQYLVVYHSNTSGTFRIRANLITP